MKWLVLAFSLLFSSAQAQVGLPFPVVQPHSSGPSFALTYQSSATSTLNTTTIGYGTMTYGSGTRVVAVLAWLQNSAATAVTAVSVNSVPLTQISGAFAVENNTMGGFGATVDVWESSAPISGTSGAVSVTYSQTPNSFSVPSSISLYLLNTTTPTPSTVASAGTTGAPSVTLSGFVVPSGGGALSAVWGGLATAVSSWTPVTTDATEPDNQNYGHTTSTGTIAITATGASSDGWAMSAVSWSP